MSEQQRVALITGITGQDGSYLAEFLIEKNYIVHGIKRRSSSFNTERIDHLYKDLHLDGRNLVLHYGDLSDTSNLVRIIQECQPDEIYNLGAQSHVAVSFESPEYTADVDAIGTLRILEAIRILSFESKSHYYHTTTSKLSGIFSRNRPKGETTHFNLVAPIRSLSSKLIGSPRTIVQPMGCMQRDSFNNESKRKGEYDNLTKI